MTVTGDASTRTAISTAPTTCIRCGTPLSPVGKRSAPAAVAIVEPARRLAWLECGDCRAWTRVPFDTIAPSITQRDANAEPFDDAGIVRIRTDRGVEVYRIGAHVGVADRLRFRFGTRVAVARRPLPMPVRILAVARVSAYVAAMAAVVALWLWPSTRPLSGILIGVCYGVGRGLETLRTPLNRRLARASVIDAHGTRRGVAGEAEIRIDPEGTTVLVPVRDIGLNSGNSTSPARYQWLRGPLELLDVRDAAARAMLPALPRPLAFDRDIDDVLSQLADALRGATASSPNAADDPLASLPGIVRTPSRLFELVRRLGGEPEGSGAIALERLDLERASVLQILLTAAADGWLPEATVSSPPRTAASDGSVTDSVAHGELHASP